MFFIGIFSVAAYKRVAEDKCEFVAQHVTLQEKINVLPDSCLGGVIFSAAPSEMCRSNCWDYLFHVHIRAENCIYMNTMFSCFPNKGD